MSEDLIRQLADFRSTARRHAERTYQSQDNKKINSFVSLNQPSPTRQARSTSSFINLANNRTKPPIIIPKPTQQSTESLVEKLRDTSVLKKTNNTENSFIANYLKRQEETDFNSKKQKPPTSSFKVFLSKPQELPVNPTSHWNVSQNPQIREASSSRWNLNTIFPQHKENTSSHWNLGDNQPKESSLWKQNKENNQFLSNFQETNSKNPWNQQSSNKSKEFSYHKNLPMSNYKKPMQPTIVDGGITELLPKSRIQQLQDFLIDCSEEDFNRISGDYIEELIKLSSVIMYKVKNSKYYKE